MRYLYLILLIFYHFNIDCQGLNSSLFHENTSFIIGLNEGSSLNLLSGKMNINAAIESAILFKNTPLTFSGRISTEKYISGRSSYIRLSYDGYKNRKLEKIECENKILIVDNQIENLTDTLQLLEAKIAYLENIKLQMNNSAIFDTILFSNIKQNKNYKFDTLSSKNQSLDSYIQDPNIQAGKDLNFQDSLNSLLAKYNESFNKMSTKKDSLLGEKDKYRNLINQIDYKKPKKLINGIDKLDIGMTALSQGSMSRNTIPVNGLRIKGKVNHWNYDGSAGFTIPNKLFSNSIFDQINNNSQNIFNLNQYYTVNSSRFVSSLIFGYGNQEKNFISAENYYNGKELKNLFTNNSNVTNLTSNISSGWSPFKNFFIKSSLGKTFKFLDTTKRNVKNDFAFYGQLKYSFTRISTSISANYRHVGASYDGFSQGIYNSGFDRQEYCVNSKISKKLTLHFTYYRQQFNSKEGFYKKLKTQSVEGNFQWRIVNHLLFYGGYTLVEAKGIDTLAKGLNHLAKLGFVFTKSYKFFRTEFRGLSLFSHLNRENSPMKMLNINLESNIDWKLLGGGIQIFYQDYQGLFLIYGKNWIVKPEFRIHSNKLNFLVGVKLLKSEQFGQQHGEYVKFQFMPSNFFMWDISFSRWLPTEALYIPNYGTERYKPYFFELKMHLFFNNK